MGMQTHALTEIHSTLMLTPVFPKEKRKTQTAEKHTDMHALRKKLEGKKVNMCYQFVCCASP